MFLLLVQAWSSYPFQGTLLKFSTLAITALQMAKAGIKQDKKLLGKEYFLRPERQYVNVTKALQAWLWDSEPPS